SNGTVRIAEAIGNLPFPRDLDFVVNVQADHPQIAPVGLSRLAALMAQDPSVAMATLASPLPSASEAVLNDQNVVKVGVGKSMNATWFSRSPEKAGLLTMALDQGQCCRHVGVYAYRFSVLRYLAALPPSTGELREDLEQLRPFENGISIRVL